MINFREYPGYRKVIGSNWTGASTESRRQWLRNGIVPLDYPAPVAADWPDLLAIAARQVKPERQKLGENADARRRKTKWWLWGRYTPALFSALAGLDQVLVVNCGATPHLAVALLPSRMVFAHSLALFSFATYTAFCMLQSRVHEIWARFFGSSMKDDLRYTPSDCFETFPFPGRWETDGSLETAGRAYYEYRAALMVEHDEGMTKTYNRFHDIYENNLRITELRELHTSMDRAVLDAYGWTDIATDCEFLLDYEIDEARWGRKKKPYRYRWPDTVRDEVLARLLALNAEQAADEADCSAPDVRPRRRETPAPGQTPPRGAGA